MARFSGGLVFVNGPRGRSWCPGEPFEACPTAPLTCAGGGSAGRSDGRAGGVVCYRSTAGATRIQAVDVAAARREVECRGWVLRGRVPDALGPGAA